MFGIPPFLIQPYLQLPKISSYFDAMSSLILNDHTYAGIEDAHKVSISPEGEQQTQRAPETSPLETSSKVWISYI